MTGRREWPSDDPARRRKPCRSCGGPKSAGQSRQYCDPCRDRIAAEYKRPAVRTFNVTRFESNVERVGDHWMWRGSVGANEYPEYGGLWAHRVAHEIYLGPIPEGYEVDHLCRIPLCVNPQHLEAVTPRENRRRQGAARTHCVRGHEYDEENTIYRKDGSRLCAKCVPIYRARENAKRRQRRRLQRVADELHTMAVECDRRGDAERRSA